MDVHELVAKLHAEADAAKQAEAKAAEAKARAAHWASIGLTPGQAAFADDLTARGLPAQEPPKDDKFAGLTPGERAFAEGLKIPA